MNKRVKKKHNNTKIEEKIKCLKEAYIASMFNTLMKYSDETQRWDYHAARKAACIYVKTLLRVIRFVTNDCVSICKYLDYSIHAFQKLEYSISYAKKELGIMFAPPEVIYKPLTPEELNGCLKFFGSSFVDKVTQDEHPVFNAMMDHSKRREELRAKLPGMEPIFDALDREREWLNSRPKPTESNLKVLYAKPYEVEDSLIISESAAKKLNGTVEGLMNYHGVVAGNDIGFGPRMEMDKDGNMRLISVDLCHKPIDE